VTISSDSIVATFVATLLAIAVRFARRSRFASGAAREARSAGTFTVHSIAFSVDGVVVCVGVGVPSSSRASDAGLIR
jgi:hypothetical protein